MKKKKVMLADRSEAFCANFELTLRDYSEFEFVGAFNDGEKTVRAVKNKMPDILVLDLMLPEKDGLDVLKEISAMQTQPAVIATTSFVTTFVAEEAAKLGAKRLFVRPVNIEDLMEYMQELPEAVTESNATDGIALERKISKMLHSIGTPADLRGYHYLIEAIKITIADKEAVFEMTKNIYEPVAKQFHVTAQQISKAITRAILTAWDRGDLDTLQGYFGYTVSNTMGYPTNSEFIAIVAERIRLGIED